MAVSLPYTNMCMVLFYTLCFVPMIYLSILISKQFSFNYYYYNFALQFDIQKGRSFSINVFFSPKIFMAFLKRIHLFNKLSRYSLPPHTDTDIDTDTRTHRHTQSHWHIDGKCIIFILSFGETSTSVCYSSFPLNVHTWKRKQNYSKSQFKVPLKEFLGHSACDKNCLTKTVRLGTSMLTTCRVCRALVHLKTHLKWFNTCH